MGIRRDGIFAMLTNFRNGIQKGGKQSRGQIVGSFLVAPEKADHLLPRLRETRADTLGYNLVFGSVLGRVFFYSSTLDHFEEIQEGIAGVSNASLNTPWPKVRKVREGMKDLISEFSLKEHSFTGGTPTEEFPVEKVFSLFSDPERARDEELPSTGVPLDWERLLSAPFIQTEEGNYGTRSTSVGILDSRGRFRFVERSFSASSREPVNTVEFSWTIEPGRADLFGVEGGDTDNIRKEV